MTRNTFVEAELGRVACMVTGDLASFLRPREYIYSMMSEELICLISTTASYRKTSSILNRVLRRLEGSMFKTSTLSDHIESRGRMVGEKMHDCAREILCAIPGISEDGTVEDPSLIPDPIKNPGALEHLDTGDKTEFFHDIIMSYNTDRDECDQIKNRELVNDTEINPDDCVYVSIDDVGVRHQKDSRKDGGKKTGKVVENTVIHVQSREGEYTITDVGMKKAFTLLMAYLMSNNLLVNRHLYFFSDGASNIRKNIETFFKDLCPYKLMLDWYHLEKRMNELCSMALKGSKEIRHDMRYALDCKLWAGNFDEAMSYLKGIDPKFVKNDRRLEEAIEYLERKKPYAACYALRRNLRYRNSSNPAEKANDIIVARRQKHNGMSWSYEGSGALAAITALMQNNKTELWVTKRNISFVPKAYDSEVA